MVSRGIGDGTTNPPLPAALETLPKVHTDTLSGRPQHLTEMVIVDPGYVATCTITVNNVTVARDDKHGVARCDWQTGQ